MPQVADVASGWGDLLRSVRIHRNRDARHLKPTCLYVVAEALDEGRLNPEDIDPGVVMDAMAAVLVRAGLPMPDRLWRPVWHLTNDGAWDFLGPDGRVGPERFGPNRKPESFAAIAAQTDRIAVTSQLRRSWLSAPARAELRAALADMLENDDANSRRVAAALAAGRALRAGSAAPDPEARTAGGQGAQADLAVRLAVERHAMTQVRDHFTAAGWSVEDISATESHDLLCNRADERLLVEVKGTTGFGRKVILTANEVALARGDAATALAIVSAIELSRVEDGVSATGGELRLLRPWSPQSADLRPLTFEYRVPPP